MNLYSIKGVLIMAEDEYSLLLAQKRRELSNLRSKLSDVRRTIKVYEDDFVALSNAQSFLSVAYTYCGNVTKSCDCLKDSLQAIKNLYSQYIVSGLTKSTDFSEIDNSALTLAFESDRYKGIFDTYGSGIDDLQTKVSNKIDKLLEDECTLQIQIDEIKAAYGLS